jgi:hypothetical protein
MIEINKIPNDKLEAVIRTMNEDLERRKHKAMKTSETDNSWIKIESLQWVLFVIFTLKNERAIVIGANLRLDPPKGYDYGTMVYYVDPQAVMTHKA